MKGRNAQILSAYLRDIFDAFSRVSRQKVLSSKWWRSYRITEAQKHLLYRLSYALKMKRVPQNHRVAMKALLSKIRAMNRGEAALLIAVLASLTTARKLNLPWPKSPALR